MENPAKMDDLGVPLFYHTPIFSSDKAKKKKSKTQHKLKGKQEKKSRDIVDSFCQLSFERKAPQPNFVANKLSLPSNIQRLSTPQSSPTCDWKMLKWSSADLVPPECPAGYESGISKKTLIQRDFHSHGGTPKWMACIMFIMENSTKMDDDWGYP